MGHVGREILSGRVLLITAAAWSAWAADAPAAPTAARRLWQNGRYAEAQEAYDALPEEARRRDPPPGARSRPGPGRCLASQGEYDQARASARRRRKDQPDNADLRRPPRRPAILAGATGRAPRPRPTPPLKARPRPPPRPAGSPPGSWTEAKGETRPLDAWKWFVDHYNAHQGDVAKNADAS